MSDMTLERACEVMTQHGYMGLEWKRFSVLAVGRGKTLVRSVNHERSRELYRRMAVAVAALCRQEVARG